MNRLRPSANNLPAERNAAFETFEPPRLNRVGSAIGARVHDFCDFSERKNG